MENSTGSGPLRSAVAVVGGYIIAFLLVAFTFNALATLVPDVFGAQVRTTPPVGWMTVMFFLSFVYSSIAGYVTAVIAKRREMMHAMALAGFMFVLGVATTISMTEPEHRVTEILFTFIGVAGIFLGAKMRARITSVQALGLSPSSAAAVPPP